MPTSTLYHSAAKKLSPVRVTVKSDVLPSKFPGKPSYVCLEIAGTPWNYSLENPTCGEVFEGRKGETFTVVFDGGGKGNEDSATVTYVGEAASDDGDVAPAPARPVPATRPKGVTPHNTSVPPGHPARVEQPASTQRTPVAAKTTHFGATVGMCVKAAVDYCIAEGIPFDPNEVFNRASDLVRVAEAMEGGRLAEPFSKRMAAQP